MGRKEVRPIAALHRLCDQAPGRLAQADFRQCPARAPLCASIDRGTAKDGGLPDASVAQQSAAALQREMGNRAGRREGRRRPPCGAQGHSRHRQSAPINGETASANFGGRKTRSSTTPDAAWHPAAKAMPSTLSKLPTICAQALSADCLRLVRSIDLG